ncbi:hypothetical protein HQP04_03495 [Rhodococcus fascians]|nr:hypothetical protein [Rhodococcus fascians]MBY4021073.1 hypothetical protein [Rhodococcus fascians]
MINAIAWSVAPGSGALNRPRRFVEELVKLGVISSTPFLFHHGRSASTGESTNVGKLYPTLATEDLDCYAVLSPVLQIGKKEPRWIDYYDDWSLAPDINPIARVLARTSYSRVGRGASDSTTVTVNTAYMAMKLQLPLNSVVPNGVDKNLASVEQEGDDRTRVIVLGKLFSGRTDEALIREIAELAWIDEVLLCGIGDDKKMTSLTRQLKQSLGAKVRTIPWVQPAQIGRLVGEKTFALIPHKVNDYTLSQDLMKAYLLSALGVPIVCPQLLWPHNIDREYAFLLNAGVDLQNNLAQWNDRPRPPDSWRLGFVDSNSWASRAESIAERISA